MSLVFSAMRTAHVDDIVYPCGLLVPKYLRARKFYLQLKQEGICDPLCSKRRNWGNSDAPRAQFCDRPNGSAHRQTERARGSCVINDGAKSEQEFDKTHTPHRQLDRIIRHTQARAQSEAINFVG